MNEASKVDRTIADRIMGDKKMKTRLKYFWQIVFCLTVLLGSVLARLADGVEPKPMNIVLFLIDDLGWRDLGCQGSAYYQTPHIDRLAQEGVRFTDAYAACAVCSPTRAALLACHRRRRKDVPQSGL